MTAVQVQNSAQILQDFNDFISNVNTTSSQSARCIADGDNLLQVVTGRGCDFAVQGNFTIQQTATSNCKQYATSSTNVTSSVKTNINENIDQFLNQKTKTVQGWLAAAFAANIQGATTQAEIVNKIKSSVTTVTSQVCDNTLNSFNSAKFDLCGSYARNINISQNAIASGYNSCAQDVIIKAFQQNSVLQQIAQKTAQSSSITQEGIGSLFFWLVIIAAIIGVVLVIGVVLYLTLGGKGGKKGKKGKGSELQQLLLLEELEGGKGAEAGEARGGLGELGELEELGMFA